MAKKKLDLNNYGPGRPPLPATMARMQKMMEEIEKSPGIHSARLAKLIGVSSLECATLADRLIRRGFITKSNDDRARIYFVAEA